MAHFTYFLANFRCLRCGRYSESRIQTYLFKEQDNNWAQDYRAGDREAIDGLHEFEPLYPWDGQTPLVLAVGDWACRHCDQSWRWAKVTLSMSETSAGFIGSIVRFFERCASADNWGRYMSTSSERAEDRARKIEHPRSSQGRPQRPGYPAI